MIVGGGIIGVCTAYYLAKAVKGCQYNNNPPIAITILEANEIASGASGKAAGLLAKDWHSQSTSSLGHLSFTLHADLARELNGEVVYGYRHVRCFGGAVDIPKQEQEGPENDQTEKHPEHIVDVPPAQPTRTHPSPLPSSPDAPTWLRSPEKFSLVADEETTAQVHPYLFTRTIFQECLKLGVKHVQGRASSWDRKQGVLTIQGQTNEASSAIPATTLIITAGPWSGRVAKELVGIDVPISYLPGHSLILQSPTSQAHNQAHSAFVDIQNNGKGSLVKDITRTPEIFLRPDGTIYVAGENTGKPLPDGTKEADDLIDPEAIEKLRQAVRVLGIAGVEVQEQLCYRPLTRRGVPIIGKLQDEVYIATGHGPWGISLGPGTGKVLCEVILGHSLSADISDLEARMHL